MGDVILTGKNSLDLNTPNFWYETLNFTPVEYLRPRYFSTLGGTDGKPWALIRRGQRALRTALILLSYLIGGTGLKGSMRASISILPAKYNACAGILHLRALLVCRD